MITRLHVYDLLYITYNFKDFLYILFFFVQENMCYEMFSFSMPIFYKVSLFFLSLKCIYFYFGYRLQIFCFFFFFVSIFTFLLIITIIVFNFYLIIVTFIKHVELLYWIVHCHLTEPTNNSCPFITVHT